MGSMLLIPLMMFGGLYSRFNTFPAYISWMQYISPFKYGFSAAMWNQLEGVTFLATTLDGEVIVIDPLYDVGITWSTYNSLGVLLAVGGGFYVMGFFALKLLSSKINA